MKKRLIRVFFILFVIFSLAAAAVYLVLYTTFFHIDQINISGNEKVSQGEIVSLSGIEKGTNILVFSSQIASRSIEVHPMIKQANITRQYPATIDIVITERIIWAIVPNQEIFLCIDDEGVCIDRMQRVNLTQNLIITLEQLPENVNLGQVVDANAVAYCREIWTLLNPDSRTQVSQFHYTGDEQLLLYTRKGTEIRLGDRERLEEKVQLLERVFIIEKEMEAGGADILHYVDLRFKGQPVVKTKNRG